MWTEYPWPINAHKVPSITSCSIHSSQYNYILSPEFKWSLKNWGSNMWWSFLFNDYPIWGQPPGWEDCRKVVSRLGEGIAGKECLWLHDGFGFLSQTWNNFRFLVNTLLGIHPHTKKRVLAGIKFWLVQFNSVLSVARLQRKINLYKVM